MIDPVSISVAIAGVSKVAQLVKQGIDAANDVGQVTRDLGKLFDHTETIQKAKKEINKKGTKSKSLNQTAMDLVVAEENGRKALAEIKHKLYWGNIPNGAEIWTKFLKQRQSLIREQKLEAEREAARKKQLIDNIVYYGSVVGILAFGGFMIWFLITTMIKMANAKIMLVPMVF